MRHRATPPPNPLVHHRSQQAVAPDQMPRPILAQPAGSTSLREEEKWGSAVLFFAGAKKLY
jgi:hypothetical protein